jgi:hypothetical protein
LLRQLTLIYTARANLRDMQMRNSALECHILKVRACRKATRQRPAGIARLLTRGTPKAQFLLGIAYQIGEGVSQDYAQAAFWYRKAAEQGHEQAQAALVRIESAVPTVGCES